jgi:hypothetical protein
MKSISVLLLLMLSSLAIAKEPTDQQKKDSIPFDETKHCIYKGEIYTVGADVVDSKDVRKRCSPVWDNAKQKNIMTWVTVNFYDK